MKRRQNNSGFTLLELTCALFIITTAGFGALQLYNLGVDKTIETHEFDLAAEVLRNEVEQVRSLPFDEIVGREGAANPSPAMESLFGAQLTLAVEETAPGLKTVAVSIRWQNRHGRWKTRSLATRVARREMGP